MIFFNKKSLINIIFSFYFVIFVYKNVNASDIKIAEGEVAAEEVYEVISGFTNFPSAFRQDENSGLSLDFSINNIIGEIAGKRTDSTNNEYTNPVLMSIVTLTGKWTLLSEKKRIPALSSGVITSIALDLGNELANDKTYEFERSTNASGYFVNLGKSLNGIDDKSNKLSLGYVSGNYSKIFSNLINYMDAETCDMIYTGMNFKYKNLQFNFELIKALNSDYDPIILNLRLFKKIPVFILTFVKNDLGESLIGTINLRIPIYPPYSEEDLELQQEKQEKETRFKQWQSRVKNLNFK